MNVCKRTGKQEYLYEIITRTSAYLYRNEYAIPVTFLDGYNMYVKMYEHRHLTKETRVKRLQMVTSKHVSKVSNTYVQYGQYHT